MGMRMNVTAQVCWLVAQVQDIVAGLRAKEEGDQGEPLV